MLFSSSSNIIVNNSFKKYIQESTNKYVQSIVKNDKVIEFIKTPVKCELCYLKDEHKFCDSEIIFFRNKFSKYTNFTNPNPDEKTNNFLNFYFYFLSTSIFFIFEF